MDLSSFLAGALARFCAARRLIFVPLTYSKHPPFLRTVGGYFLHTMRAEHLAAVCAKKEQY